MVIRRVSNQSLSELAEEALWIPMGAEADATWTTDSKGAEFNCVSHSLPSKINHMREVLHLLVFLSGVV